ncbi:MAG TPA: D-TA family PLP-dependent enzyme [Verrucomicrobiae bacterium]|nr:D-TA family PLP-dependent enzyme [Verrucomicrobiae bacterium]
MDKLWYKVSNVASIPSPALLVYPERIAENIRRAIQIAGGPERLRPHIKTHKCSEVLRLHLATGIKKFKCATIAEAEMAARAAAPDVLIAAQLAGPNLKRLEALRRAFPRTVFATIADNGQTIRDLSKTPDTLDHPLPVYLDINCGMDRTGIYSTQDAFNLYALISRLPGLIPAGLHVYDGHIHDADLGLRESRCEEAFAPVEKLRSVLEGNGLSVPTMVAGGTPTFPIHARHPHRESSPGTYVFWDFGYQQFADLDFQPAAVLLTRVISKPTPNRLCLDLGHKAVASENPHPRVQFLGFTDAAAVTHSEEHLVIATAQAPQWQVGDVLYGIPRHICPTVALHDFAHPVTNGIAGAPWKIEARQRQITI